MKKLFLVLISTLTLLVSASIFVSAGSVTSTLDFTNVGTGIGQTAATGDGYSWKDNTLTINNLTLNIPSDDENDTCGIILPANATLVVKGTNTISVGEAGRYSYGIKAAGKLTIKNSGTLNIKAGSVSAIYTVSYGILTEGDLICSSCKLNVESGQANTSNSEAASYGAFVVGKATFSGGKYTFKSNSSCSRSIGLKVKEALTLKKSAELSCTSGNSSSDYQYSCGTYVEGGIDIESACRIEVNGGNTSGKYADAIALYTESYLKTYGAVVAASGKAKGEGGNAYAVYAEAGITTAGNSQIKNAKGSFTNGKTKALVQNGSDPVEIFVPEGPIFDLGNGQYGKDSSDHTWAGYEFVGWYDNPEYTGSKITSGFENGKVYYAKWKLNADAEIVNPIDFTIKAAPSSGKGFIWNNSSKTLTLNKFQMKITSDHKDSTYGICLPDGATIVLKSGTKNTIKSGTTNENNYGILCVGTLTIKGKGTLTSTAGEGKNSFGIYCKGELVNSANISGYGGVGDSKSYGIYADGLVTNSGNMTAVSKSADNANGLYLMKGINNTGVILAKAGTGRSGKAQYANGINSKVAIDINDGSVKAYGGYAAYEYNGIWAPDELNIKNDASVELFLHSEMTGKSVCLDVTKVNLDSKAKINVTGIIWCGKYGGKYTVSGAQISTVAKEGNPKLEPTGNEPIRVRNMLAPLKTALVAKAGAGSKCQIIAWDAVSGAEGYEVYYAKAGDKLALVSTVSKAKTSYKKTGLSNTGKYSFQVKAFKYKANKKVYIQTSPQIFTAGTKASYSNATKVSVNKSAASLIEGNTLTLTAKVSAKSSAKTLLYKGYCNAIRYISSNGTIARVSSKGKITAKSTGRCIIYVIAPNGLYETVTIKVF